MLSLFLKDSKMLLKNKIALLCFLFLPAIVALLLSKAMSSVFSQNLFVRPFTIAVVDYDKSIGSQMALSSLKSEGYIKKATDVKLLSEKQAMEELKDGSASCAVIIPEGFSRSLYFGENKPVKVYLNTGDKISSELAKTFFNNAADLVVAAQSGIYTVHDFMLKGGVGADKAYQIAEATVPEFILTSMGRNEVFDVQVASNVPQTSPTEYYAICVSVMFIMFAGILGIWLINQDFESGVMTRIMVSPVGSLKYIMEKAALILVIGVGEYIMSATAIAMLFKTQLGIFNFTAIITVVTIILTVTLFCILISLLSKSSSTAVTASIISIFLLSLAGGCIYPIEIMTVTMKFISRFMFSSWAVDGMVWALTGGDYSNLLPIWGAMLIFSLLFTMLSLILIGRRRTRFF